MGSGASVAGTGDSSDISVKDALNDMKLYGLAEVMLQDFEKEPVGIHWLQCFVEVTDDSLMVKDEDNLNILMEIPLESKLQACIMQEGRQFIVEVRARTKLFRCKAPTEDIAKLWSDFLRREILASLLRSFENRNIDEESHKSIEQGSSVATLTNILPPKINIVILVVGTRGDVQPFVYLGQALQKDGHRVRLATHAEYRDDVTVKGGLEYYPLGGDPRKLSEFMVKTEGRLMPDLTNAEERKELPEKMKMIRDIILSTFPACTAVDPEDPEQRGFLADAIISNPVSYGHIHVAEALGIPLHIMFPQPWSPTKCFPHPLSNLGHDNPWCLRNYYSYKLVDEIFWIGIGSIINEFRRHILGIPPIRTGEHGDSLLNDNKVPISHMWSPSFVPKCPDWPEYVDVVGEYRSLTGAPSSFVPPPALMDFLGTGSETEDSSRERPIYIGFGSMVIGDSKALVAMIKEAAEAVGCRILLQSGWTKYAEDNTMISDNVMVIGAMPHDWLLYQVSAVIHHGGAGTTSAGLRAGNPTFICPFFGDQHFWAEMVHRAGVGPRGCPITDMTVDKLKQALLVLRSEDTVMKAREMGDKMNAEDGVSRGVESFYRNLPLENMICEVSIFHNKTPILASIYCADCDLKMCMKVHEVVHRSSGGRKGHHCVPFRPAKHGVVDPHSVMDGLGQGFGVAAYEVAGGVYDLFAKPIEGAREKGVTGAAHGMADGLKSFVARPVRGGKVLLHHVASATHLSPSNHALSQKFEGVSNPSTSTSTSTSTTVPSVTGSGTLPATKSLRLASHEVEATVRILEGPMQEIEKAYNRAEECMSWWKAIDKDGNRTVDRSELRAYLHEHEASGLLGSSDHDEKAKALTFTEFAWIFADTSVFSHQRIK